MIFGRHELYLYFETRAYSLHYEKFADGTVNPLLTTLDFPDNWLPIKLSQILRVSSGKSLKRTQLTEDGNVPVYGAHGIMGSYSEGFIEKGTLLIGRVGFYAGSIMRTKEFSWVTDNSLIVSSSSVVNSNFLELSLKHLNLGSLTSQTAQPVISGQKIYSQIIFLPPVNEQTKIVDSYNELISKVNTIEKEQEQLKQLATQLKQKVLDVAMQGKLVPQDPNDEPASVLLEKIRAEKQRLYEEGKIKKKDLVETELVKDGDNAYYGKLPESWVSTTIGAIISKNIGGGTPSKQNPNYWNGNIPWASVKDINSNYLDSTKDSITQEGLANSSANLIPTGTAIIATRMSLDKIVINTIPVAINQDLRALFFENKTLRDYFINIYPRFKFKSTGTTVKGISLPVLNSHNFPLPGTDEQTRINTKLTQVTGVIDNLTT